MIDRIKLIKNFMKIIDKNLEVDEKHRVNESLVVAIDGEWGSGKSVIVEQWMEYLNKLPGNPNELELSNIDLQSFKHMQINAWEFDNYVDSIIALIFEINSNIEHDAISDIDHFKLLKEMTVELVKHKTGIDISKFEDSFSAYTEFVKFKEQKEKFIEQLDRTIDVDHMMIFIDELDRCSPSYAIRFLEDVKHLFNNKRLIFVFTIDLKQLERTASTIYGVGMNSTGYLIKFFNTILELPSECTEQYVLDLVNNSFDFNDGDFNNYNVSHGFAELSKIHNLSFRDINFLVEKMKYLNAVYDFSSGSEDELFVLFSGLTNTVDVFTDKFGRSFLDTIKLQRMWLYFNAMIFKYLRTSIWKEIENFSTDDSGNLSSDYEWCIQFPGNGHFIKFKDTISNGLLTSNRNKINVVKNGQRVTFNNPKSRGIIVTFFEFSKLHVNQYVDFTAFRYINSHLDLLE